MQFQSPVIHLNRVFPFLEWKKNVTKETLRKDTIAGLIGAFAVLPQAVAFATIAGLPPQYGIYAAIVPAIIAALFGSSKHLVSGPTTAISLVVFASLVPHATPGTNEFISLAITLSFLVGAIQLLMGWMRLGSLLNFISHTVIVGFTAGAAILIASSQLKNFLGIAVPQGSSFYETIATVLAHIKETNPYILLVAMATLLTGILFRRYFKKIPYMLPAILVGSLLGLALNHFLTPAITGLKTIGAIPASLPPLSFPNLDLKTISLLASSAFAVTLLALTEAAAIAHAIALRSGDRINTNREFVGQGLSNVFGSFFSAYPASGSFNRSGLNYEAGAQTPLASVFAALALIVIVLFVSPLAAYLPLAVMAAILFLVAWGLIDFHHIRGIWRASYREFALLLVTFLSTLFIELEFAIFIGTFFSIALYLHRSSMPAVLTYLPDPLHNQPRFSTNIQGPRCPQLSVVRIEGALFFGSVNDVETKLHHIKEKHPSEKNLLLVLDSMPVIDLAGLDMLVREKESRKKQGGDLFLTNLSTKTLEALESSGHIEKIGRANIFRSKNEALKTIVPLLSQDICSTCPARIFRECPKRISDNA
ncbi:MAG: sodium-independent anion transporter [Candidatus Yonathbacteria bacterium RIFCSPLOWO2_01_FULL_47_33b]|uniref:Sodium-independent anion transporter n=1 Tax=Candidatus Yonathbacteria bacterium RIFCSPLOWO2_01_FULL_47_33b TaxID=1802727 RepID=A0A1G2SGG4_9BACT|nr:MAG: sodium-independent anion transporter [Candidatus Yonathbacteria bacterium RIFCSPLOWO2_01_FULL_47_33b]